MTTHEAPATWEAAVRDFRHHDCTGESDVCACRFVWACPDCGRTVSDIGEGVADRDYHQNPLCDLCYAKREGIDL